MDTERRFRQKRQLGRFWQFRKKGKFRCLKHFQHLRRFFSMPSLYRQVFWLCVPLCIVPIFLVNIFFYKVTRDSLRDKQSRNLIANVDLAVQSVNNELTTMVNKAVLMLMDKQVCNVFSHEYEPDSVERQSALFMIRNRISQILNLDIARSYDMKVYSDNMSLVDLNNVYPFDEFIDRVGEENVHKLSLGHAIWMCPPSSMDQDELWLSCKGLLVEEAKTFTILLVIPGSLIRNVLSAAATSSQYSAYVSPERVLFKSGVLPEGLDEETLLRNDTIMPFDQDGFLLVSRPTRVNRFRIVLAVPFSQLDRELVSIWMVFAAGLGMVLFFLLPASAWGLRAAFGRLTGLLSTLEDMNIDSPRWIEYNHNDELSIVITRINGFIQRNAALVNERYAMQQELHETQRSLLSTQLREKELELNLLQMQINPHFLYNAFSSIKNSLNLGVGSHKLADAMDALSSFYRLSLNLGRSEHTIRDELSLARHYIDVQTFIQPQPFEIIYDFKESVLDFECLPLLIQPAIENVFKHAHTQQDRPLTLVLTCEEKDDMLCFVISDNGVGFSPDEVASGHGLKNISDRIMLHYADKASLFVCSELGQGTEVVICIPLSYNGLKTRTKETR